MSDQQVIPVKVALRARPLIPREENEGCQTCLWFHPQEPQVILGKDKAFTFDYVFSPSHNQVDVYQTAAQSLVASTFEGYNATVLAYGQTGSGKTFSMGGCYEASLSQDEEAMGIIPRILRDLFKGIADRPEYSFKVTVSYLEIYNEELLDLLCPLAQRQALTIREEMNGEIKIKGMKEEAVGSFEDTLQCLTRGAQSRTTGATAMNDTSSRSHAIFTVYIEKSKKDDLDDHCVAKFHLVDLAGSERAKRTRAEGERFKEGVNINRGLLSLGNVISALGEDGHKRGHIPYRDSKLTRLLQDSLGGNSHTLMVACVSPADSNMEETLNTLRYADRARKIKNKPVINRDPQSDEIMRLRHVVESLQMQLLQQGGGSGDTVLKNTTSKSAASANTPQDVQRLTQRTSLLERENAELTRELERAIEQNTRMCQTIIQLEASRDHLESRLASFKDSAGVDLDLLSSSLAVDGNQQLKEELDKLKKVMEAVKEPEQDEEEQTSTSMEDEEEMKEEDAENQEDPSSPDSRAQSTEHVLRQAKMSRELQELNQILAKKQELASQMNRSEGEITALRSHYETMMKEWEVKVAQLEKEKNELSGKLNDNRANANTNKISEQRRKRLQELETEMSTLRRKMAEQAKAVKLKEQAQKQVNHLNTEILALKQQRVKLMKQMKEESDHWRKWKQQKDKLEASLPKSYSCQEESGASAEKSCEEEAVRKQIEALSTDIELRNVQIQDLQQKICDADQENKGKSMWESLHTMMEAKCALKWLLEQAVDGKADRSALQEELKAAKEASKENKEVEQELEEKIQRMQKIHEEELLQLKKEHQQKTLFLLGMEKTKKTENTSGDETLRKKLNIQSSELSKMSSVVEELEKKTAECEELRRKMTGMMMIEGKVALMPSIHDPESSPFRTPRLKPQMKAESMRKLPPISHMPETPGGFNVETDDDWDDDENDDPDWRLTPYLKQHKQQQQQQQRQSSGSQCGCKSDCSTRRCSCTRSGRHCAVECGCDIAVCQNKQPDTTVSSSSGSSVLNSTFNIESADDDHHPVAKPQSRLQRSLNTTTNRRTTTRTSRTKLLDLIQSDEARSSDEFEKPAAPMAAKPSKRSGEMAFIESEEFKSENSKRRRTILSTKNLSYFSPVSEQV